MSEMENAAVNSIEGISRQTFFIVCKLNTKEDNKAVPGQ